MLVEPLCCFVDVVVCSCVGAADDHDGNSVIVDAVVVGPSSRCDCDCEKWRCESAAGVRDSGREALCASLMAGRNDRIVFMVVCCAYDVRTSLCKVSAISLPDVL